MTGRVDTDERPDPPPQFRIGIRLLGSEEPGTEAVLGRLIFQQMSVDARRRRHLRGMRRLPGEPHERRDAYRVELSEGPLSSALVWPSADTAGASPPRSWRGRVCNLSLSGCAICLDRDGSAPPATGSQLEISLPGAGLELRGVVVYQMEER